MESKYIGIIIRFLLTFTVLETTVGRQERPGKTSKEMKLKLGLLVPLERATRIIPSTRKVLEKIALDQLSSPPQFGQLSFEPIFSTTSLNDSFLTTKATCQIIENRVVAAIGVDLGNSGEVAASIFNYVQIPFIQINPSLLWSNQKTKFGTSINMYPNRQLLNQAVLSIVNKLDDNKPFVVLYQDEEEVLLWQKFLEQRFVSNILPPEFWMIPELGRLNFSFSEDPIIRKIFQFLKSSHGDKHFVFHSPDSNAAQAFLEWFHSIGMILPGKKILITALDLPERVLKPYMYLGAEITFIALQQQKTAAAAAASESPSSASKGEAGDLLETIEDDELSVTERLLWDSLEILWEHLTHVKMEDFPYGLSCLKDLEWKDGVEVIEGILKEELSSLNS